jgi:hypothetical protein
MNSRPITDDDLNVFVDQRLDPGRHAEVVADAIAAMNARRIRQPPECCWADHSR